MYVKRPGKVRRTYALINDDGKTVSDPRIDKINQDLKAGAPRDVLEERLRAVIKSFRPNLPDLSFTNQRLVEECHRAKLLRKPYLADPGDLKQRLMRAAGSVGGLSLREASEIQILEAIAYVRSPSARFEIVRGINELLKFAKRDFSLHNPKPPRPPEIVFIRIPDFISKCLKLPADYRAYLGALFATGCRFAELPVARLDDTKAVIESQLDREGSKRLTKNKKGRISPVLPPLRQFVSDFVALGPERARELRLKHYEKLYRACKAVFGIRLHDLRHSYAVEWGAVGASTYDIARYIGDTVEVCERHYRNFCATPDEIQLALKRFG